MVCGHTTPRRAARPGAHTLTQVLPQGPHAPQYVLAFRMWEKEPWILGGLSLPLQMLPVPERCAYHPPPSSSAAVSQAGTAVTKLFRQFTAVITP